MWVSHLNYSHAKQSPALGRVEWGDRHGKAALALLILLAGFIVLQGFLPLGTTVQIGADEGFELAKTTLGLHGHGLYTELCSDQPPLHTFLVVQALKRLSPAVLGPRLVTVIAAAVLLLGVFSLTYRVCGVGAATKVGISRWLGLKCAFAKGMSAPTDVGGYGERFGLDGVTGEIGTWPRRYGGRLSTNLRIRCMFRPLLALTPAAGNGWRAQRTDIL
jgi:hypothetical protein